MATTSCAQTTLKEAFKNDFLIGAALSPAQFCESNQVEAALVKAQFNSISPENVMKWEVIHPELGQYDFSLADRYVAFGVTNGNSRLNDWPVQGRTSYPLHFDRAGKPKPAFDAVLKTALEKTAVKLSAGESALAR